MCKNVGLFVGYIVGKLGNIARDTFHISLEDKNCSPPKDRKDPPMEGWKNLYDAGVGSSKYPGL